MANIAILNYCNLNCPYCFANKFITEEEKELITDEQLENILEFMAKSGPGERIGLIGGEPTCHPNFRHILERVLEFSKEHHFIEPLVFTNGILIGEYAELFREAHCLVNLNSPETIGEENWNKLVKSLKRAEAVNAGQNITLGINLYPGMPSFDFALDLAVKFRKTEIRCSYVAPTCKFTDVDKEKYYTEAKPTVLAFIKAASEKHITVALDCNQIPDCYYTPEELEFVHANTILSHKVCDPVLDISPDMKATACFGAYHLVDMTQFENEKELIRYLQFKEMYTRTMKNGTGKCATCKEFELAQCQGGCLAFANKE